MSKCRLHMFPYLPYQSAGGGTQTNIRNKNVKARYATGFEKSCKYNYIFNFLCHHNYIEKAINNTVL
jgi:hypothetical protein